MFEAERDKAGRRRYGAWAGNPRGTPEDPARCVAEVSDGYLLKQCGRPRGHGPGGLYCKQHGKKAGAMLEAGA
jgi:hypothetical protein